MGTDQQYKWLLGYKRRFSEGTWEKMETDIPLQR
jgi:hypothetical protein